MVKGVFSTNSGVLQEDITPALMGFIGFNWVPPRSPITTLAEVSISMIKALF